MQADKQEPTTPPAEPAVVAFFHQMDLQGDFECRISGPQTAEFLFIEARTGNEVLIGIADRGELFSILKDFFAVPDEARDTLEKALTQMESSEGPEPNLPFVRIHTHKSPKCDGHHHHSSCGQLKNPNLICLRMWPSHRYLCTDPLR